MIKIYTFSHKRPDFLELQLKSFKKNLEDDFEFIVYNNATFDADKNNYNNIHLFCNNNNILCVDVQKDEELINKIYQENNENVFNNHGGYTNAAIACAYPLCYSWKHIMSKSDNMICIIDSDMFFVEKENISNTLNEYDIVYMPQSRGAGVHYMWNGICYMNLKNMPNKSTLNWWCGFCEGQPVDVGGHTFYYLKEHSNELKLLEFKLHYVGEDPNCNFSPANYEYLTTNDKKTILHYRGGSNWDHKTPDYHAKKTQWLKTKL